jgi:spore coat polysaccharide biosynthesis predicted glycosyltransferase SpsG/RimJ/RimL family protein N-acetyltransferase
MSHDQPLIALRPATADDARAIWEWRNDAAAREASFSSEPIPWESHEPWFAARLADPATRILIALAPDGAAIGFVRFDLDGDTAVISIGLAPASRGHGYGRRVIAAACAEVLAVAAGPRVVIAYVKPGNEASLRAFRAAGFAEAGTAAVRGREAVLLELPAPAAALLVARPDVGAEIGFGHLRRCLTVAAALREMGVTTTFLLPPGRGSELAAAEGCAVEPATAVRGSAADVEELAAVAHRLGARAVLVDSYVLDPHATTALRAAGLRVALFDDLCTAPFDCELMINGGLGAERLPYGAAEGAAPVFLLGAEYAPLRPGVLAATVAPGPAPGGTAPLHALLTFGGSDPSDTLPLAIAALDDLPGPPHDETNASVVAAAAAASRHAVTVVTAPPDFPALLATADIAVSAGGGTLVELAAAGVPSVAVEVAPNQSRGIHALAAAGATLPAGATTAGADALRREIASLVGALRDSPDLRAALAAAGPRVLDGRGAGRIALALARLARD